MNEKYMFENFKVTCKYCNSENVELKDSRGWSHESGSWGEVEIVCVDCDNRETILENE